MLRESAKNQETFNKMVAQMAAQGKYSPEMAKLLGEDPSTYDTLGSGSVWNMMAPSQYSTIEDMLLPTISSLKNQYKYDPIASKLPENRGYNIYNVSDDRVRESINSQYGDLLKLPAMQYHLKQSGMNEDQFKELLASQVRSQLGEKREYDQVLAADQDRALKMLQIRLNQQNAAADRALKMQELRAKNGNNGILQFTDKISIESAENARSKMLSSFNSSTMSNYFDRLAKSSNNAKNKQIYEKSRDNWKKFDKLTDSQKVDFLRKNGYIDADGNITSKAYDRANKVNGISRGASTQSR
uniref:DNA pilot protein n=1 Tax=Dulem virus 42 TaxID=3145760 RepID=A0AAU8BA80_9CAUD